MSAPAGPRVFRIAPEAPDLRQLDAAAALLRRGGLVAFPTETVYGLGVDAANAAAIERLNQVKGRPPEKPYSWHVHSAAQVRHYAAELPPGAQRLIDRFWPGPLTIILPVGGGRTIGFRLPDHPVALAFLKACGVPVAAPSANRSGQPPPTDGPGVLAALGDGLDALVDAGPTPVGRESTVVEVAAGSVQIRREGAISRARIAEALKD